MTIQLQRKPRGRYQHGNLHAALLAAAEKILEEHGIQALTLRAAARAVGVSHTAPQNHFGDLTGLLSELAAVGYQRFAQALQAAALGHSDSRSRNLEVGRAYVRFAMTYPGMFVLMFRSECLDAARPALREGMEAARAVLRQSAHPSAQALTPLQCIGGLAARWSVVHGFAVLLTEGRLNWLMQSMPDAMDAEALLEAALNAIEVDERRVSGSQKP